MKHVLVSFSLALVAFFAPTTPIFHSWHEPWMGAAITVRRSIVFHRQKVSSHQREVHAVVVDMPQRASLEFASPDTWGALPTFDPPEEESPTKPVLQVALN